MPVRSADILSAVYCNERQDFLCIRSGLKARWPHRLGSLCSGYRKCLSSAPILRVSGQIHETPEDDQDRTDATGNHGNHRTKQRRS